MKSYKKFLTTTFLLSSGLWLFPVSFADAVFSDVEEHKYEESIYVLHDLDVVQGYSDGNFYPDQSVNRAELLKMAFAALEEDVEDKLNCFEDVEDEWFAEYICHAKEADIVSGYSDGTYRPGQEVNMAEAFKILTRSFDLEIRAAKEGEDWYAPYRQFMHVNNLVSKYSYFPWRSATRGEVAFWIHQFLEIREGDRDISTVRDPGSAGCSTHAPDEVPTEFLVAGETRTAIVEVPEDYDPNAPYSLILAFHGRTSPNDEVQGYYRLNRVADEDAIIVYPAGKSNGSSFTWSDGGDASDELRDYEFFDVIVEEFTESYCINEDEIYAVGHSLGAWFSNSLACARGNVLRAVGTLGGSRSESVCTGPVSVMQWHNPNDRLAAFYTGQTARDWFLEQNFCTTDYESVEPEWGNCVEYQGCLLESTVVWCPHEQDYADWDGSYYPHNWPRETGGEIWEFFEGL